MYKIYFQALLLCCLIFNITPALAQKMSINDAYRAIPHKQTPYDFKQSRIRGGDARYLDHYFFASDIAMRARVMMLRNLFGQKNSMGIDEYNSEINDVLNSFTLIQTPKHLQEIENLLIGSINDQKSFFNEWVSVKGTRYYNKLKKTYRNNKKVQSSHHKLIQAYSRLKQIYPKETKHNQTAFYDHLCALDFI